MNILLNGNIHSKFRSRDVAQGHVSTGVQSPTPNL